MRRILLLMAAMLMLWSSAEATPECVMLKFTDDTRFDQVNTAGQLSQEVMIKLQNDGRLSANLSEELDVDLEARLYEEKVRGYEAMERAMSSGDFNELFEEVIDERKAQSIASAQVGQIISPELTSKIGRENGAEYLIQGTIVNLGVGNWMKNDDSAMSRAINMTSTGSLNPIDIKKSGIGLQCDVRLIKASTGEIVWLKRVVGIGTQKMIDAGGVRFGRAKLNEALLSKAIDNASDKIVEALTTAFDAGQLS